MRAAALSRDDRWTPRSNESSVQLCQRAFLPPLHNWCANCCAPVMRQTIRLLARCFFAALRPCTAFFVSFCRQLSAQYPTRSGGRRALAHVYEESSGAVCCAALVVLAEPAMHDKNTTYYRIGLQHADLQRHTLTALVIITCYSYQLPTCNSERQPARLHTCSSLQQH